MNDPIHEIALRISALSNRGDDPEVTELIQTFARLFGREYLNAVSEIQHARYKAIRIATIYAEIQDLVDELNEYENISTYVDKYEQKFALSVLKQNGYSTESAARLLRINPATARELGKDQKL